MSVKFIDPERYKNISKDSRYVWVDASTKNKKSKYAYLYEGNLHKAELFATKSTEAEIEAVQIMLIKFPNKIIFTDSLNAVNYYNLPNVRYQKAKSTLEHELVDLFVSKN